jgi:UDP-GlcNAc3NAcA epimerase
MKIITILGARPQFIKAGTVSREMKKHKNIDEVIVHTGQHFDKNMSDIFFEEMSIPKPNYNLNINGLSHGAMTGQMIEKIESVLIKEKPDWVMVYGDTNSTLAGAIAASKLHIKIAHIEAGLRSFNMNMPEEINRILTDRISNILFCPTIKSKRNLENEGFRNFDCRIIRCGDVMYDGALYYKNFARKINTINDKDFVLCTIHRAENTDNETKLKNIIIALQEIAKNKLVVLPLHPRTKKIIEKLGINVKNLLIIEPVGYLEMIWLIDNCRLVMTDSGGLQKEAFFFNKPCLTLRDETEWIELTENGYNVLVGTNKDKIIENFLSYATIDFQIPKENMQQQANSLYGNGKASEIIINEFLK